jgi:hypothetical protein
MQTMAEQPASDIDVAENWVNVTEAAEILGYHRKTVAKLVLATWKLPEDERQLRLQRRSNGYMIWLPDLIQYADQKAHAPRPKLKY